MNYSQSIKLPNTLNMEKLTINHRSKDKEIQNQVFKTKVKTRSKEETKERWKIKSRLSH